MKRRGYTLVELVVAMAILIVLIYMSFAAFSFVSALSRSNQGREAVLEDMSTVLDQVTKELRQTATVAVSSGVYLGADGVQYPLSGGTRDITAISSPDPPLSSTQYYSFGANNPDSANDVDHPILTFYVVDDAQVKHRISYTLGVPTDASGKYEGTAKQYWVSQGYEPCEVLYSNESWKDTNGNDQVDSGEEWASGIHDLPIISQVITNFTVTRPSWSETVVQIVIEAMVRDASGKSVKITRMVQVTLRQ